MLYNFPEKIGNTYTTRAEIPNWYLVEGGNIARKLTIFHSPAKVSRVGDFTEEGLTFLNVKSMDFNDALSWAKEKFPTTYPDMTEWMQWAAAAEELILARQDEYISAGSYFDKCVGDAYIPGVRVDNIYFERQMGRIVTENGYAVIVTPQGNFNCPVPGKVTIVTKNILAWAADIRAFIEQHVAALIKYIDLAKNPQKSIGFLNLNGLTAPLFFVHEAKRRAVRNIVEMGISSNKEQIIVVRYRSPSDYTKVFATLKFKVPKGQNVVKYRIFSLFGVPPMVVEVQPENQTQTILNYYEVKP